MSSDRKLRETLQAVLNDCRDTADVLDLMLGPQGDVPEEEKEAMVEKVREHTRKLHVFVHTYCSKNNEEFKLKENNKHTLMPTSIRNRLEELDMLQ